MKINGRKIQGVNVESIIIPRGNAEDIILTAEAVLDFDEFDALVPKPIPGKKMLPGGIVVQDENDENYKEQLKDYASKRGTYMVLKSLRATEGLEWETVNFLQPDTWKNYEQELKDSGFTQPEMNMIMSGIASANGLNQEKLDEARARFLARLMEQNLSTSQKVELVNTQSGEPANGSV